MLHRLRRVGVLTLLAVLAVMPTQSVRAQDDTAAPQQRRPGGPGARGVYKATLTPHWFADNTRFWYRNDLRGGTKEFILVDVEHATRQNAFDHAKLAAALSKAADKMYKADRLPFDNIEFAADGKVVRFQVDKTNW